MASLTAQATTLDALAAMYRAAAGAETPAATTGAAAPAATTAAAANTPAISLELAKESMIKLIAVSGGKRDVIDAILVRRCGSVKPVKEIPADVLGLVHADVLAALADASAPKPVGADDL